jgi:hypothetical protein
VFDNGEYNPTLQYQLSGAHYTADFGVTKGTLRAMLPYSTVQRLYPAFTNQDALTYFNVSRQGDTGSQDSISFKSWSESDQGTSGLVFEVKGVTFSAPTYVMTHNGITIVVPSLLITTLLAIAALFVVN